MIRGDREQEDHMECLWDMMRSIPSLEVEDASVLDEFYWLDKDDPHRSLRRMTRNRGEADPTDGKYLLSSQTQREINLLCITRDEDLFDKGMNEVLGKAFFESNFWVYWRTMFDFYEWHSALEMKRYLLRFLHHIDGQPNLTAVKYTRYNQYESFVLPLVAWLKQHGVVFQYETKVTNVQFAITPDRKVARRIDWIRGGQPGGLDLTENDLVFLTNGSLVENSTWGDHHTPATFDPVIREGNIWSLWRNIAKQDPSFGRPDKFCTQQEKTVLTSASLTTLDGRIPPLHQEDYPAGPVRFQRSTSHRRPLDLPRLRVGDVVELPTAAPLQGAAARPDCRLDLRAIGRPARRLRQEADEGMHRRGDNPGVAIPPRRADRADSRYRGKVRDLPAVHHAVLYRVLRAPSQRRPAQSSARARGQFRVHWTVRRDRTGHDLHHRILRAHRDGSRLHVAQR